MSFDYSEYAECVSNFSKLTKEFDSWLTRFLLQEGQRFIAEVKPRTPVDAGDLRSHWQLDGITQEGGELKVWFINPMYYATFVEYGHAKPYKSGAEEGSEDWVNGYFMMTISLDKIEKEMPSRFESEFNKFISRMGVV